MRKAFYIFLLIMPNTFQCLQAIARESYLDSLYLVYNDTANADSMRLDALYVLSYSLIYTSPDSARMFSEKLIDLAVEEQRPDYEARAHTVIGAAFTINGQYLKALDEQLKAAEGFNSCGMDLALANVDNNIGMIYINVKDFKTAISFFKKAIRVYKRLAPNSIRLANAMENTGIAFVRISLFDSAAYYYKGALSLIRHREEAWRTKSSIYSEMADLMNHYKKNDSAIYYYRKALDIQERYNDHVGMAAILSNIGLSFLYKLQPGKSIELCRKGLELAKQVNSMKEIMYNCLCLYKAYDTLHQADQALKYYKQYIELRDSTNNLNQSRELARKEIAYYYSKKQLADSLKHIQAIADQKIKYKEKQLQLKQAKMQGLILLFSLLFLVILALFIYYRLKITRAQKKIIEKQKERVEMGKMLLEQKNTEIMDSMRYAKRIQDAILPPRKIVKEYLPHSFILYKPKDIVAGDFYWMEQQNGTVLFAAADCTGHGVPGAMVSVVCHNALNRSVREHGLSAPGEILDKTREIVMAEFAKSEEDVKDGMDIALCALQGNTMQYAGAYNPLWMIRPKQHAEPFSLPQGQFATPARKNQEWIQHENRVLYEIKADKQPIGKFARQKPFLNHLLSLEKGDLIYLFSDGYADQFGGPKGKKFKYKTFKKLLLEICEKPMDEQRDILIERFELWKGSLEQVDDICVIGVRV